MNVQVNISGDRAFMTKLVGAVEVLSDFHEGLGDSGKHLVKYFGGEVFESMGGVYGTPWKALSPATQAYKSIHYRQYAAVPLQASGTMRQSFKYRLTTPISLEIYNTAPYFKYHQSTAPRQKIPRRAMFKINKTVKEIIRMNIQADMNRKLMAL